MLDNDNREQAMHFEQEPPVDNDSLVANMHHITPNTRRRTSTQPHEKGDSK